MRTAIAGSEKDAGMVPAGDLDPLRGRECTPGLLPPRLAPWDKALTPLRGWVPGLHRALPTARAVGYHLPPLRGWEPGASGGRRRGPRPEPPAGPIVDSLLGWPGGPLIRPRSRPRGPRWGS